MDNIGMSEPEISNELPHRWSFSDFCRVPDFGFSIEYSAFPVHSHDRHTHDFAELVLVRHGTGVHQIHDEEFAIGAGDAFFVPPDLIHGYKDIEGLDLCNIIFDPRLFVDTEPTLHTMPGFRAMFDLEPTSRRYHAFQSRLHIDRADMRYVYDLLEPIEEEYKALRPGFQVMIRTYFLQLVVYLARAYAEQPSPESRELMGLSSVVNHIETRYPEPISLAELAEAALMSESTLLRSFRRCFNTTPIEYLIRHRLRKACERMQDPEQSLTDIAQTVGFSDSSYFSRRFKQEFGKSPREYRRRFTS